MDAMGGGVLVLVAAALWIVYLLPMWLNRHQYDAHERNAVRLQQTLRILAETAETPEAVRLEANARTVAAQQRILREREQVERLEAEAAAALAAAERRQAAEAAARAKKIADAAGRSSSIRKRRALTSLGLLLSLLVTIGGVIAGAFGAGWIIAGAGLVGASAAFVTLSTLARAARRQAPLPVVAPVAPAQGQGAFEPVEWEESETVAREWTPRPLPKPLHLSRGTIAASAMASIDAAAELRKAAALAELERRAAEALPATVRRLTPAPVEETPAAQAPVAEAPSRFASMGIIDDSAAPSLDLDAALRRRRLAG